MRSSVLALFGFVMVGVLVSGCRISLDEEPQTTDGVGVDAGVVSKECMMATGYSDLPSIETGILAGSCVATGCHNGAPTAAGKLDLRMNQALSHLVNVDSKIDPRHKLVVPGQPKKSYLLLMIKQIAAD